MTATEDIAVKLLNKAAVCLNVICYFDGFVLGYSNLIDYGRVQERGKRWG